MANIELREISKVFTTEVAPFVAVRDLSLEVSDKELVSLIGPSGCGKTTILNVIAGFLEPTSGEIRIDGGRIKDRESVCGVVFQADSVFPWMSVRKNIGYGLAVQGMPKKERENVVEKYLHLVGLTNFADDWPRKLSGGMKKRVDLARAYAANPEILLLDEPFGSLDVLTKESMQMLLLRIWQAEKKTIVLVSHDIEEAIFLSHRVVVMTPSPGTINRTFDIPFEMPRDPSLKLSLEFLELRRQIVEALTAQNGTQTIAPLLQR